MGRQRTVDSKVKRFLNTNLASCTHHGEYSQWSYFPNKISWGKRYPAIECKLCRNEGVKDWQNRHPKYNKRIS